MTQDEIFARELWGTCVHESGHMVVSNVMGFPAYMEIWRNEIAAIDAKSWLGRTHLHGPNDPATKAIICMAGLVSEIILIQFAEEGYAYDDAEQEAERIRGRYPTGRLSKRTGMTEWCASVMQAIYERIEAGEASETDLDGMGDIWPKRIRKTVGLVMRHSSEILFESECIRNRVLSTPEEFMVRQE